MNNSNDSMSFIALNNLKHETYNMCCRQVELKLTDLTLLDAPLYPSMAKHGGRGSSFNVCVPHHH